MTDKQKFGFYLPVWRQCAEARGWKMAGRPSRLVCDLAAEEERMRMWPEPAGPAGLKVILLAHQMAAAEFRGVTAEDLRRACTLVATGDLNPNKATESSKHLNNTQVNHVVTLFRLLMDPDNLAAVTDWLHPEDAGTRGMVDYLRKLAPEATLRAICRNAFGSADWEGLDRQKLVWLLKNVKGKRSEFAKPVVDRDLQPF